MNYKPLDQKISLLYSICSAFLKSNYESASPSQLIWVVTSLKVEILYAWLPFCKTMLNI